MPPRPLSVEGPEHAARILVDAITAGELDDVDRAASALADCSTPDRLRALLGPHVVASLAAAADASILLWLLPRVTSTTPMTTSLLREPSRELARHPDWRIRWFEAPGEPTSGELVDVLRLTCPCSGNPGATSIFPIMNQAEESGVAPRLLGGFVNGKIDAPCVRNELARVAAWSMLQEPPDQAPYGWSHCLTMPQAVMGIAGDGVDAVNGCRGRGHSCRRIPRRGSGNGRSSPTTRHGGRRASTARRDPLGPEPSAAAAWHSTDEQLGEVMTALATNAALHHDAHLVKYTLACFDAAEADPPQRRLYLAAAASLAGYWAQQPSDDLFA